MVLCVANPFGILQEVPMEDIVFMKRHHRVSHMWIYMEPAVNLISGIVISYHEGHTL